jgi:hypothetical protein
MKNVSFTLLDYTIETLQIGKKVDLPTLADALSVAKLARKRADDAWDKLRALVIDKDIKAAESDNIKVSASFRTGGMRWDSDKINDLLAKHNLKPEKFKKQDNDSLILNIKAK